MLALSVSQGMAFLLWLPEIDGRNVGATWSSWRISGS